MKGMLRKPATRQLSCMGRTRFMRTGSCGAAVFQGLARTHATAQLALTPLHPHWPLQLMPVFSGFGHIDSHRLTFGPDLGYEPPKEPDEYELSIGKITDVLRSDYPDFFERSPDFGIYDEHVTLELGKPLEEPKVLARGKSRYCRRLLAMRRICSSMVRNGTVSCQVCDGRPYGSALRVYWKCQGEIWLGSAREFHISAVSYYSVAPQLPDRSEALQFLAHRINRHTIDITEIRPSSLQSRLLNVILPQADLEPALVVQASLPDLA